jgi:predicted Rossmann fold nucleotide-binding protein DprA/Smf involved in DNA uptake
MWTVRVAMAALYARGLKRPGDPSRKKRTAIEDAIRKASLGMAAGPSEVAEVLNEAGFWYEAQILQNVSLWQEASDNLSAGTLITTCCPDYPADWLHSLGELAPPVLWKQGSMPVGKRVTIVGSRDINPETRSFAKKTAIAVSESGGVVVSGGARGTDRIATSYGPAIEVWPCGILWGQRNKWGSEGASVLSPCAPNEPFSGVRAMERNLMLYALSPVSLVVHARFREGGSWQGAVEALRRKIGQICVPRSQEAGLIALASLGATVIEDPKEVIALMNNPNPKEELQAELFAS